jgi:hypothetical protein
MRQEPDVDFTVERSALSVDAAPQGRISGRRWFLG